MEDDDNNDNISAVTEPLYIHPENEIEEPELSPDEIILNLLNDLIRLTEFDCLDDLTRFLMTHEEAIKRVADLPMQFPF